MSCGLFSIIVTFFPPWVSSFAVKRKGRSTETLRLTKLRRSFILWELGLVTPEHSILTCLLVTLYCCPITEAASSGPLFLLLFCCPWAAPRLVLKVEYQITTISLMDDSITQHCCPVSLYVLISFFFSEFMTLWFCYSCLLLFFSFLIFCCFRYSSALLFVIHVFLFFLLFFFCYCYALMLIFRYLYDILMSLLLLCCYSFVILMFLCPPSYVILMLFFRDSFGILMSLLFLLFCYSVSLCCPYVIFVLFYLYSCYYKELVFLMVLSLVSLCSLVIFYVPSALFMFLGR